MCCSWQCEDEDKSRRIHDQDANLEAIAMSVASVKKACPTILHSCTTSMLSKWNRILFICWPHSPGSVRMLHLDPSMRMETSSYTVYWMPKNKGCWQHKSDQAGRWWSILRSPTNDDMPRALQTQRQPEKCMSGWLRCIRSLVCFSFFSVFNIRT